MAYFVITRFLYEVALFVFSRYFGDHLGCGYEKIEWIYRIDPINHYRRGINCQCCIFGNSLETTPSWYGICYVDRYGNSRNDITWNITFQ